MKRATMRLLALGTTASLLLAFCACSTDSDEGNGAPAAGGAGGSESGGASAGGSTSGGADTGGTAAGGSASGGAVTGGSNAGGSGAGGEQTAAGGASGGAASGGSDGGGPEGTPYVFVGSTDGMLRVFTMDTSDGSLTPAGSLDTGNGLDFIAVGPDDRTVFVSFDDSVSAFTYDPTAKSLTLKDSQSTFGAGTHVAVDPTGGFVFVAHYNEGALSFLPYSAQSGFGQAQKFTPGKNAHQVRVDASGTHVFVPCLGDDFVAQYTLNPGSGTLTAATPPTAAAGNGPRHLDFHPTAAVAYVVNEVASAVQVFDVSSGLLTRRPSDEVFMSPDEAFHQSSDIHVTPDGAFVYAANRQPSELVRFRVEADHSLTRLGADPLNGVVRSFGIDPAGGYLQVGGNNGRLAALKIDAATGAVSETSAETGLGDIHATVVRYLEP